MKKSLSFLLVFTVFCMTFAPFKAAAVAPTPPDFEMRVDASRITAGETVTFTVSADGVKNVVSGSVKLDFPENFELVSASWLLNSDVADFDVSQNRGVFLSKQASEVSGDVLAFTLKAIEGSASALDVSAEIVMKNASETDAYNGVLGIE